jgi:hypothetical protein
MKCPLCGSHVHYQGLSSIECSGPDTCPNFVPVPLTYSSLVARPCAPQSEDRALPGVTPFVPPPPGQCPYAPGTLKWARWVVAAGGRVANVFSAPGMDCSHLVASPSVRDDGWEILYGTKPPPGC